MYDVSPSWDGNVRQVHRASNPGPQVRRRRRPWAYGCSGIFACPPFVQPPGIPALESLPTRAGVPHRIAIHGGGPADLPLTSLSGRNYSCQGALERVVRKGTRRHIEVPDSVLAQGLDRRALTRRGCEVARRHRSQRRTCGRCLLLSVASYTPRVHRRRQAAQLLTVLFPR